MSDKVFLDTNVLVYSYSNSETEKQSIARKLITDNNSYISTQVLQELTNTATRKLSFSFPQAENAILECIKNNILHSNTVLTIKDACRIAEKYSFSFYDSLIIAAALECDCPILYSEDMSHNQIIDGKMKIINPFR